MGGVGRIAAALLAAAPRAGRTRVLAIDGRSGAGKTRLAAELSAELAGVCGETDDPQRVRAALRELSWALLDATLAAAPPEALTRAARIANWHVATLTPDHCRILRTIQKWGSESSNLAIGEAGR